MSPTQWLICVSLLTLLSLNPNAVAESGSCGEPFKGKCSCGLGFYDNKSRYIVNCTDTGFENTDVLSFMPIQTEVLIFTGNRVPELPWNIFGTIKDYPKLSVIDMSNNHIREIRGKTYHHVASVEILILNHNNLSISDSDEDGDDFDEVNYHHPRVFSNFLNLQSLHLTNAFAENTSSSLSEDLHDIFMSSNLTKLNKLHLEQNEIRRFSDRNVFCGLPALRDLHLGDNYLNELNFNVICLNHLRFLDLERNRFEQVRQKDMMLLDKLESMPGRQTNLTVDLSKNPFVCDCKLHAFIEWAPVTHVAIRRKHELTCRHNSASGASAGYSLVLEYESSECQLASSHTSHGHVVALAILLGAFLSLLLMLLIALAYMSRDRVRQACTPILTAVSKKVHYTTIKDEDHCPEVHV